MALLKNFFPMAKLPKNIFSYGKIAKKTFFLWQNCQKTCSYGKIAKKLFSFDFFIYFLFFIQEKTEMAKLPFKGTVTKDFCFYFLQ